MGVLNMDWSCIRPQAKTKCVKCEKEIDDTPYLFTQHGKLCSDCTSTSDAKTFLAVCPMCDHKFPIDLECISMKGCESDPHYGTDMTCPKCGYEEDIHH